ncbi:hypothetical protein GCM10023238_13870 [Streptomyces heliomycini]
MASRSRSMKSTARVEYRSLRTYSFAALSIPCAPHSSSATSSTLGDGIRTPRSMDAMVSGA